MTHYIRDNDDKTSDLDLDYDREVYGDNDAWEDHVTPDEIEESLERESEFYASFTRRGINPFAPTPEWEG